jgi:23S rRNA pseudouridine1911/1915/1917 synthase
VVADRPRVDADLVLPAEPVIVRQALHAWRVALAHPRTGEPLALEAPLPADMAAYAAGLRAVSKELAH